MSYHARRFDRAAGSYAARAGFQARMAERLSALLPPGIPGEGPLIEFGCGTGLLTRVLSARFPASPLLATDAATRMLAEAERGLGGSKALAGSDTRRSLVSSQVESLVSRSSTRRRGPRSRPRANCRASRSVDLRRGKFPSIDPATGNA